MKSLCCITLLSLLTTGLLAQRDSAFVRPVFGLQEDGDQIASCMFGDRLVVLNGSPIEGYSDIPNANVRRFRLDECVLNPSQDQVLRSEWLMEDEGIWDEGSACFHAADSTLWFSTSNTFGGAKGHKLKIYRVQRKNGEWGEIEPFVHNSKKAHCCHPWLDETGTKLFFSTDRKGGVGGMDIWYSNLLADGWSQPIWTGEAVNTSGNELFPTLWRENLYFSSDGQLGAQQLDLYQATSESQWQSVVPMPVGLNSPGDDLQLVFTAEDSGFVTSNRSGASGDDVYRFRLIRKPEKQHGYFAMLKCKGMPLQNIQVKLFTTNGELLLSEVTREDGRFDIAMLEMDSLYSAEAMGISNLILKHTQVYIVREEDNTIVQIIPLGADGKFQFELLPRDDEDLPLMEASDESILTVDVEGQIYDRKPGDIGRGKPVYIMSEEGELLAMAYTSATGKFLAEDVRPQAEYDIRVDEESRARNVIIYEDGEQIIIPLNDALARYRRLSSDRAIEIMDEYNRPIEVATDDVFILKNIYYQYDSAELNDVAKVQLEHLSQILKNNPSMEIELSSHTDSRGTAAYNLDLSERRAQSAINFMERLDISIARLTAVGYGETQLLNNCDDDVPCPELEHARNRRTELRMVFE